jgi:hypothetical protein
VANRGISFEWRHFVWTTLYYVYFWNFHNVYGI